MDDTDLARLHAKPIPEGSILFAKIGEAIRHNHRVIAGCRLLIDNNAMAAIPKAGVTSRYLYHYLKTVDFYRLTSSTTVPSIRKSDLEKLPVPLPGLAEQRRIVAVLDQAEELRAKRRSALAQLDALTSAIFMELFGDPATNPKGWPIRALAELCEVKGGKRLPKGEEYSTTPTPFRYIRVLDIKNGLIDESALVYLKPEVQAKIKNYTVSSGDVVISIAGSTGLVAPVTPSLSGANLTENAAKLVARGRNVYDHQFLSILLRTPFVQQQISSQVGQVTIGKLALFRIERLRLPLPPYPLQQQFAGCLAAVQHLESSHQESLGKLNELFASLQHRAFRGEL